MCVRTHTDLGEKPVIPPTDDGQETKDATPLCVGRCEHPPPSGHFHSEWLQAVGFRVPHEKREWLREPLLERLPIKLDLPSLHMIMAMLAERSEQDFPDYAVVRLFTDCGCC